MSNIRRIVMSFGTTGAIQVANIVAGALLARTLGPEQRGLLASIVSITSVIAAVTSLSISDTLIYMSSSSQTGDGRRALLQKAMAIIAPLALVGTLASAFFIANFRHAHPENLPWVVVLFSTNVIVNHLSLSAIAYLLASQHLRSWGMARIFPATIPAIGAIALAPLHMLHIETYLLLLFLGNLLATGTAFLLIRNSNQMSRQSPAEYLPSTRDILKYSSSLHLASISNTAREHLDRVMITLLLAPAALGQYAIAGTLATLPMLLATTLDTIVFPRASSLPIENRVDFLKFSIPLCNWLVLAGGSFLFLISPIMIKVIFGNQYLDSIQISQTLIISYTIASCKLLCGNFLKSTGKPLLLGKAELITLTTMAIALPLGIHIFGPIGAARGMVLAQAVSFAYILTSISNLQNVEFYRHFTINLDALKLSAKETFKFVSGR